ncbi:hypothetical protein AMAG_20504 [Allomyces macrogynus ATCC 38327]|uniref:G-protein coupled receptors family 3 profile domain-containing protein n=1 Tax=Allomyces macrogynus (strain ATCC 38327) TaxID=578462 RepID=A0A0L0TD88_ALLM3|nr:hypothetical protein AMAG_20504 [Allomyces macrogynus ATCC 38327]|eukprot:KNE72702.1 hypothetical protein AMAG_20504 [Allomyces macrogynus ATCC 38327]
MAAIDPNHNYQLVIRNSASVRLTAVNALDAAVAQQPVHALVGDYSSRVTLGLALSAYPKGLWHCGVSSATDFDNAVDFPRFFRVMSVFSQTFASSASSLGIALYSTQQYQPGTTDFGVYLDTIAASGSKVIAFLGFPADAKLVFRQAKLRGMIGADWAWMGPSTFIMYLDSMSDPADKQNADGFLFTSFSEDRLSSQFQSLKSQYVAQYPTRDGSALSGYALLYYDCLLALAHGFNALTPTYGDAAIQAKNYSAPLSSFLFPFNGTTGSVSYVAPGTRTMDWEIFNIYGGTVHSTYKLWQNGTLTKSASPIFYGGSTTVPIDRPPLNLAYPQWSNAGVLALAAIRAIMMVLMLMGMGFLVVHRHEKQIRQLSMPFLLIISLGCILILVSEYLLIDVPSVPMCHASTIVFTLAFELVFASAVAKTYRIFRIFANTRINKGGLKSAILLRQVGVMLAAQAILFAIWIAAFPVWPTLITTKASMYYVCSPTSSTGHWAIIGLTFAYNAALLLAVCYLAVKTRNVDSSYRETSWILHAAQNVALCSVVIIPLSLITVESFALTAYYVRSIAMLYAVGFTYMALVGRLLLAVWAESRTIGNSRIDGLNASLKTTVDMQFQTKPGTPLGAMSQEQRRTSNTSPIAPTTAVGAISQEQRRTSNASPTTPMTAVAPGAELAGQYPVLRRGGGLGIWERFTQTWYTQLVYLNLSRGFAVIAPPPTPTGGAGGTSAAKRQQQRMAARNRGDGGMGIAIPLAKLGFDASPAGTPAACLELVHFGSGAAWVVQMGSVEEVAPAGAVFRSYADVLSVAPPAMNAIDPNHNYQLVVQDTGNVRSNAVTVLLNVTGQQLVHALVGEYSSRVTLGVALAANSRRLWHCGVASAIDFDNKQDFGSFFRIAPIGTHAMYNYLDTLTTDSDRLLADGLLFSALHEDHSTPEYQALRSSFLAQFPSRSESVIGGFSLMYFDCFLALANGFKMMTTLYGEAAVQTHSYSATLPDFLSSFNGSTGPVAFTEQGSRIVHEWQIMNIYNNSNRAAYVVSASGRVDKAADPMFYGGSTNIPADRPPLAIVYPQWTDAGVQVLAVIRGLMVLTMLGGMAFLAMNRAEKQIRQLSLPFLLFISLGCILILASEFVLIGVPSAPACHASTVVFTFGYEMVFASAIIWRIFDNTRISKGGLKSQVLFRNVAMVMGVQAILFVIWMAAFPVWPALVTTKTSLYYECSPTNAAGHWAIVGLSFAFNGVMLLLLSYLAYKTRNVNSSYRETSCVVIVPLSLMIIESFALTAYFIRSVFMLYAVTFTFMALVGRLIVAVWIERQIKNVTPTTLISTTLASAVDGQFYLRPKGSSTDGESPMMPRRSTTAGSPAQSTATTGAPGSEMGGVYPVLRRGGGLGFFDRFTQTWCTTQVYMNSSRGLVAIAPPPPGVGVARGVGGGTTLRKSAVRKRSVVAGPAGTNHDEPMGAAIPLTSLGFDASPAGAPPGCLEFVHLGSGAAWLVQMNGPEEVASWTHYLKAVASVITSTGSRTGQTSSSSSGGTNSATGNVVASGRTLVSPSPSPSPSPLRANSDRIIRTAAG